MSCARCRQQLGTESRFKSTFGGLSRWACPASAVWPPMQGVTERVYSPLIALRKMAMKIEFADSEAQDHLQALMVIVGRQSLSRSSPRKSSHNFSAVALDNHQQQQQTESSWSSSSMQTPERRPPTTRKRLAPGTQNTFSVSKSIPSVPLFVVKTTPRKQLDEMARTTQVDDTSNEKRCWKLLRRQRCRTLL